MNNGKDRRMSASDQPPKEIRKLDERTRKVLTP